MTDKSEPTRQQMPFRLDYDKVDNDLNEMKYMSIILEDNLNDLWQAKADAESREIFGLPEFNKEGFSLYVIDDQKTEVVMFAALKLGDMIRRAIDKYEALVDSQRATVARTSTQG